MRGKGHVLASLAAHFVGAALTFKSQLVTCAVSVLFGCEFNRLFVALAFSHDLYVCTWVRKKNRVPRRGSLNSRGRLCLHRMWDFDSFAEYIFWELYVRVRNFIYIMRGALISATVWLFVSQILGSPLHTLIKNKAIQCALFILQFNYVFEQHVITDYG